MSSFDSTEFFRRISKYLVEGLVVAIVASLMPNSRMSTEQIAILGLTAATAFSVLDLLAPSIAPGLRQGVGLGLGFHTVGFP